MEAMHREAFLSEVNVPPLVSGHPVGVGTSWPPFVVRTGGGKTHIVAFRSVSLLPIFEWKTRCGWSFGLANYSFAHEFNLLSSRRQRIGYLFIKLTKPSWWDSADSPVCQQLRKEKGEPLFSVICAFFMSSSHRGGGRVSYKTVGGGSTKCERANGCTWTAEGLTCVSVSFLLSLHLDVLVLWFEVCVTMPPRASFKKC